MTITRAPVTIGGRRRRVIRTAVLIAAAGASAICFSRFDHVMGLFDWRADTNNEQGYLERLYGDEGIVRSRRVVEEARLRMPEDARYRVEVGPNLEEGNRFTTLIIAEFLQYFLLPRRQVADDTAKWGFCYGCDPETFGRPFEPLADAGNGVSFGRLG